MPYPENLLPDPEMINLSDEEDEEKGNFDEKVNLFGEYEIHFTRLRATFLSKFLAEPFLKVFV